MLGMSFFNNRQITTETRPKTFPSLKDSTKNETHSQSHEAQCLDSQRSTNYIAGASRWYCNKQLTKDPTRENIKMNKAQLTNQASNKERKYLE